MSNWTKAFFGIVVIGTALAGCQSQGRKQGPATQVSASAAEPVTLLDQVQGQNQALKLPMVKLIKSQKTLQSLGLNRVQGLTPNFDQQDVVLLALGRQHTGGYWARIAAVQLVGDTLYVQGQANRPAPDQTTTQQLTYPFAAAVIPKTPAKRALSDIESVSGRKPPHNQAPKPDASGQGAAPERPSSNGQPSPASGRETERPKSE